MNRFTMYRRNVPTETHDANQRNAPNEPQFEGVVFTDGRVAMRWLTAKRSVSVWDSLGDMLAIHGHPEYESELVWHDKPPCVYCADRAMSCFYDQGCLGCINRMGEPPARSVES